MIAHQSSPFAGTMSMYELRVQLKDIQPPVWRELRVRGDTTLDELHEVLQTAMGWTNSHLYLFHAGGIAYGEPNPEWPHVQDSARFTLDDILTKMGSSFEYEYDMGDRWRHELTVTGPVDAGAIWPESAGIGGAIENRMIRYRYGPWDPAYFALLGSLIGRGLVEVLPGSNGLHFKTTQRGSDLVRALAASESWHGIHEVTKLLRRHFDLSGNTLKRFVYETFPEIVGKPWGEQI